MKKIILLLSIILLSCHSSKSLNKNTDEKAMESVKYSIILNSALYGNGAEGIKKGAQIIKSKEEWYALLKKMNSVNSVTNTIRVAPEFDTYYFVAVFNKVLGSGGQTVSINKIEENKNKMIISIKMNNNVSAVGTSVMNQPFVIFRIPKTEKKIEFKYI